MAIRIRIVNGHTVALCANATTPQEGDIYLSDGAHHALSTKFGVDFKKMGFIKKDYADPIIKKIMLREEKNKQ